MVSSSSTWFAYRLRSSIFTLYSLFYSERSTLNQKPTLWAIDSDRRGWCVPIPFFASPLSAVQLLPLLLLLLGFLLLYTLADSFNWRQRGRQANERYNTKNAVCTRSDPILLLHFADSTQCNSTHNWSHSQSYSKIYYKSRQLFCTASMMHLNALADIQRGKSMEQLISHNNPTLVIVFVFILSTTIIIKQPWSPLSIHVFLSLIWECISNLSCNSCNDRKVMTTRYYQTVKRNAEDKIYHWSSHHPRRNRFRNNSRAELMQPVNDVDVGQQVLQLMLWALLSSISNSIQSNAIRFNPIAKLCLITGLFGCSCSCDGGGGVLKRRGTIKWALILLQLFSTAPHTTKRMGRTIFRIPLLIVPTNHRTTKTSARQGA